MKMQSKKCSKCKKVLLIDQFGVHSRYLDGLRKRCKGCEREYNQSVKHRESIKESKRKAALKYHYKNRDICLQKMKLRWNKNHEKAIKGCREYYYNNRDKMLQYMKNNRNRYRIIGAAYRASKRSTNDGTATIEALEELYNIQKGLCAICGCDLNELSSNKRNLDHIVPISKGGPHSITNLQWTCQHCNYSKGNRIPE